MKIIVILFLLINLQVNQKVSKDIYGKWELKKIEKQGITYKPYGAKYSVTIDKNQINYNLDINSCFGGELLITKDSLVFDKTGCTEICCDGRKDTLSRFLNYSGKYFLSDSLLTIENKNGKFYLVRQLN